MRTTGFLPNGRRLSFRLVKRTVPLATALLLVSGGMIPSETFAASNTLSATEGVSFSNQLATVTITCALVTSPTGTISWGDGSASSSAEVSVSGTQLVVSGSHTYAEEGSFTGSVNGTYLCDGVHHAFTASFTAGVADAPLSATAATLQPVSARRIFISQIGLFSDTNPAATTADFRAVVAWGDGAVSSATLTASGSQFVVSGTHSYVEPGTYRVEVGIVDRGGAHVGDTDTIIVRPRSGLKLDVGRARSVGDGTTALSVQLPGKGLLNVVQVGGRSVFLSQVRKRVGKSESLTLILKPDAAALQLERKGEHVHIVARLTFTSLNGARITRLIPIVWETQPCGSNLTFHYTGSEQSCIVPRGVTHVEIIAVGGRGGSGPPGCNGFPMLSGAGGWGAQVISPTVPVKPGEQLYVEVGGIGGDASYTCGLVGQGKPGVGGWNGGGNGALPQSFAGSGGGGGASDVRTASCASLCGQGGGFGALISLGSRLVVAGGGGGGGSGGGAGDCQPCTTMGGNGGFEGTAGSDASGTGIAGVGGGAGTSNAGGGGGITDPYCGASDDPPPCTSGSDGHVGIGGSGGVDPYGGYYSNGTFVEGFAGGGGGGGFWGGGDGDGGEVSQANTVGGGGGGSSLAPAGSAIIPYPGDPYVEIIPG
ncbi:MAG TPA: hypothetical protein VMU99_08015 [Acidimicrobiales bacterium]|nr:hypothetical protein [Acidimicrobiales bacterium]